MAVKHVNWQIGCDGRDCDHEISAEGFLTQAVRRAVEAGWCRLGKEWFCPECAWDVQIGLPDLDPAEVADPEAGTVVVRIAE